LFLLFKKLKYLLNINRTESLMAEARPDGTTAYPICKQPREDRPCENSELFESTGWWGKKMGRKSSAKTEQEAIDKYKILEPNDLMPVVANFDNEQWHIMKKLNVTEEEKPDGVTAYPIFVVADKISFDLGTTGLGRLWKSNKMSSARTKKEALDKMNKISNSDAWDAKLLNGRWHMSRKQNSYWDDMELHKNAHMIPGDHNKQTEYYECLLRLNDNQDIPKPTREAICKIVTDVYNEDNGVQTAVGFSEAEIKERDKEDINELLHIWFNDSTVLDTLYKNLSKTGVFCVLDKLLFYFDETMTKPVKARVYDHIDLNGRVWESTISLPSYLLKIIECYERMIAIPITLKFENQGDHANMLIINRKMNEGKITFVIEHFEPHGMLYSGSSKNKNAISNTINKSIDKLIMELFNSDVFKNVFIKIDDEGKDISTTLANDRKRLIENDFAVKIIHPPELCPRNLKMQGLIKDPSWEGSCAIFSMWYALIRLLNPTKKSEDINEYIYNFLNRGTTHEIIKQITRTFTKLITLDINTRTVKSSPSISDGKLLSLKKRERLDEYLKKKENSATEKGGRLRKKNKTKQRAKTNQRKKIKTLKKGKYPSTKTLRAAKKKIDRSN